MIRRTGSHRELLVQLWDTLPVLEAERVWPVSAEADLRQVPEQIHEVFQHLAEQVGEEQLIESGIGARDESGVLLPAPNLAPGTGPILTLSETADALPYDALLPSGLLLGRETPAWALVHDHVVRAAMDAQTGMMLIVPTIHDLVICHALGLAAAPSTGIDHLNIEHLRELELLTTARQQPSSAEADETTIEVDNASTAETPVGESLADDSLDHQVAHDHQGAATENLDGRTNAEQGNDACDEIGPSYPSTPIDLVFSGWSFADRDRLPDQQLQHATAGLARSQRFLDIDLSSVAIWIPSPDDQARIEFCWGTRNQDAVRRAVLDSVASESYSLSEIICRENTSWQTPSTYLEARCLLWQRLRSSGLDPAERQSMIAHFERLLQRDVIGPLMEAGARSPDRIMGALQMEFANISQLLQSLAPFLQHDLIQASTQAESRDRREDLEGSVRLRLQMIDRLLKLGRELRR